MKKFLSLLVLVASLFVVVSCGNTGGGQNNGPSKIEIVEVPELDTSKEITVNFWHANGQALQEVIEQIIENFQELYPNITVVQTSFGDYTTLRDTITNGIRAQELPTVAQTYPDHVATYLNGGIVRELNSYIESTKTVTLSDDTEDIIGLTKADRNDYIDGFFAEGTIYDSIGTMYSIPFNKSTEVLYYNKTMFEQYGWSVPKTWDDVANIAEQFKTTAEYSKLQAEGKKLAGFSYDSEANLFITLTQQWGGEYTRFNSKGVGEYAFFNSKESKQALTWYSNQFQQKNLVTTTYFGTNYSSDAFKAGQCMMTLGSSAGASYNQPSDNSFEVGVAAYPQKDINNAQVIQQGTNVSLFKCDDEQEELAGWLFMKYLTNYDSALLWCTNTAYFPIRKSVLNSDEYQEHISGKLVDGQGNVTYKPTLQNLAQKVGLEQQDWFYTNVAFFGSSQARDEVETIVQQILYSSIGVDAAYEAAENQLIYG